MSFLERLFAMPQKIGAQATDIYWYTQDVYGNVEFYSNTPPVADVVDRLLREAEVDGLVTCRKPGGRQILTFFGRLAGGLFRAIINSAGFRR